MLNIIRKCEKYKELLKTTPQKIAPEVLKVTEALLALVEKELDNFDPDAEYKSIENRTGYIIEALKEEQICISYFWVEENLNKDPFVLGIALENVQNMLDDKFKNKNITLDSDGSPPAQCLQIWYCWSDSVST